MGRAPAVRVTRALHCNLNTRALPAAAALYEDGLGLRTRMRSHAEGGDSTCLGIPTPTDSTVWFLFDHRGGRTGPAIELAEWTTPPTVGETYDAPTAVGMQALGFTVGDVADSVERLVAVGAQRTGYTASAVDAVVLDADGVAIEIVGEESAGDAATISYARLNCVDLEHTVEWYEALGLSRVGAVEIEAWKRADLPGGVAEVPTQRLTFGDPSGFELRFTMWPGTSRRGRAHDDANHRGLYRMALAVDDVRAAVAAARADATLDPGDPVFIPLPDTPLDGLWVSFLRDPDGVTVEFVERPVR
jgi:catechol 2,3-dioxygenase-like lactoylglutathione lyase family enzyme